MLQHTKVELSCKLIGTGSMTVEHIFECVSVELTTKNYSNVIINCVYRTPGSNLETFCEKLESILWGAKSAKTICVCGEFNIDLLKPDNRSNTNHFLDIMYSLGLYLLIDKPTRITNISATLIDNILLTNSDIILLLVS